MNTRRKRVSLILVILLALAVTNPVPAWCIQENNMWSKLGRGVANTLTGYYEIVYQIGEMGETHRWPIAFFGGLVKGVFRGTLRTLAGVYEVVTFPLPIPPRYEALIEPDFIIPPAYQEIEEMPEWGENRSIY